MADSLPQTYVSPIYVQYFYDGETDTPLVHASCVHCPLAYDAVRDEVVVSYRQMVICRGVGQTDDEALAMLQQDLTTRGLVRPTTIPHVVTQPLERVFREDLRRYLGIAGEALPQEHLCIVRDNCV